jgi:hypothetical protein
MQPVQSILELSFSSLMKQRFSRKCCQSGMKRNLLFLFVIVCAFRCERDDYDGSGNLAFVSTQTPKITTTANGITSAVSVGGPNLCYRFEYFQITTQDQRVYDVYAKGRIPGPNDVCAQALYRKDTTLRIATPAPGQYVVNFQNPGGVFKRDTVQVN